MFLIKKNYTNLKKELFTTSVLKQDPNTHTKTVRKKKDRQTDNSNSKI